MTPVQMRKYANFFRRYGTFSIFVVTRILITLGWAVYNTSLVWYGAHNYSGAAVLGTLLLLYNIPAVIATLLGGLLADSGQSRFVIIGAQTVGVFCMLGAGFTFYHSDSATSILFVGLIQILLGTVLSLTEPSLAIAVQELLPSSRLALGNSVLLTSIMLATFGAPILAGILIQFRGPSLPAFLSGGLMMIGTGLFVLLPTTTFSRRVTQSSMLSSLTKGFEQLRSEHQLWAGFILGGIANLLLLAPQSVLVPKTIVQVHLSPIVLGTYQTATAIGLTGGSVLTGVLSRISPIKLTFGGIFLAALGSLGWILSHSVGNIVILAIVISIGFGVFEVAWTTFIQNHTEKSTRGRIFAIDSWLSRILRSGGYVVAMAAGSWFGGKTSVTLTLLASVFGILTIGLWVAKGTWKSPRNPISG